MGGMGTPANGVVCPRCGWRNDAIARMCGGCGQPLPQSFAPLGAIPDAGTVSLPSVTRYASPADDSPTVIAPLSPAPPLDVPPHPAYRPNAPPAWPSSGVREPAPPTPRGAPRTGPVRRGNCLVRALVTLLVVLLVLACCGIGTWTLVIRPPLHAQVDHGIRVAVGAVVTEANNVLGQLPPGEGGTARIPAALVNDQLQSHLPANLPFHNISLAFGGGNVEVRYTLAGHAGALSTALAAQGGRLVAPTAVVWGPLKLVESSSELLQAVRDELSGLTSGVAITGVTTANDTLDVTVKASGG